MKMQYTLCSALVASALLVGCGSDNDTPTTTPVPTPTPTPTTYEYDVQVINLTNAQPLSPVAVVLHAEGYLWANGEAASEAIEKMAEGGDNSDILAWSDALANASTEAPVGPGATAMISISTQEETAMKLSLATMLVNTNDAFSGLNSVDLSGLMQGESKTWSLAAYDAGTEANSEAAGTIPGPADGGEGFNAERNDINKVVRHAGVVSQHDGLVTSVLTEAHRFDNPVIRVTVTRK